MARLGLERKRIKIKKPSKKVYPKALWDQGEGRGDTIWFWKTPMSLYSSFLLHTIYLWALVRKYELLIHRLYVCSLNENHLAFKIHVRLVDLSNKIHVEQKIKWSITRRISLSRLKICGGIGMNGDLACQNKLSPKRSETQAASMSLLTLANIDKWKFIWWSIIHSPFVPS